MFHSEHWWKPADRLPAETDDLQFWRVAPPPPKKVIDLSVLMSGIDCEFWDESSRLKSVGKLTHADKLDCCYCLNQGEEFHYCQPRMNHWHNWQGGECPLPVGFVFEVIFRGGEVEHAIKRTTVFDWNWSHDCTALDDIISFRVLRVADGYCMPWEVES